MAAFFRRDVCSFEELERKQQGNLWRSESFGFFYRVLLFVSLTTSLSMTMPALSARLAYRSDECGGRKGGYRRRPTTSFDGVPCALAGKQLLNVKIGWGTVRDNIDGKRIQQSRSAAACCAARPRQVGRLLHLTAKYLYV